ncbi:MAG: hypothetical protein PVS3B1_07180 [Ktedonobacteraceae bacterium]
MHDTYILAKHKTAKVVPLWFFVALLVALSLLFAACGSSSTANQPANGGGKAVSGSATPTHSARASTGQQLANGPIVYVALGASDAVGVGSTQPGSQGYVPLLAEHLPKGSRVINLGVSGIRLHEAMQKELPVALTVGPKLITIWLVANDFIGGVPYDTYMQDLDTLLKQLHSGTQAKLVMANLPDLTLLPALSRSSATKKVQVQGEIQRWNARIAVLASQYNVTQVDLYGHNSQLTVHPEYISGDGFHPSPAGYVQLANFFWAAISKQQ